MPQPLDRPAVLVDLQVVIAPCSHDTVRFSTIDRGRLVEVTECRDCGEVLAVERLPEAGLSERVVRGRLARASSQLVALRSRLEGLQADLAWLQVLAAGGPDLDDGR